MKKFYLVFAIAVLLFSCASNKTHIKNYNEQIYYVRTNFPEIYDLYTRGEVIIDSVYLQKDENGKETVQIESHYRYRY